MTARTLIRWAVLSAGGLAVVVLAAIATVLVRWLGDFGGFLLVTALGGVLLAALRFSVAHAGPPATVADPFAREMLSTDTINIAHIRVAGVGGAGLVLAAMIAALEFQLTTAAVALGLCGGTLGALTVILFLRVLSA